MAPPIRVLRFLSRLNIGGPAKHVIWLGAQEDKRLFRSLLTCGQLNPGERGMDYFAREHAVPVLYLKNLRRLPGLGDLFAFFEFWWLLLDFRPDIIDTHTSKGGFIGRMAGALYRQFINPQARIVHTFHGHTFHGYFHWAIAALFLRLERWLATHCTDVLIALSAQQRRELCEKYRIAPAEKFHTLPLGIDIPRVRGPRGFYRSQWGAPEDTIVIGWVGRFTAIKNPLMFLEAMALVKRNFPDRSLRFVMVGDGELRPSIEQRGGELGLKGLLLPGFIEAMGPLYRDLDLLVMTSRNEGTPLAILEAMAAGVAVVATNVGGVEDLLTKGWRRSRGDWVMEPGAGERGLLVEAGNVVALANAVETLIGDARRREAMGRRGRSFVAKYHNRARVGPEIARLYLRLLGRRPKPRRR